MPEIKIKIAQNVHEKLKEYAKEDDRSLTKYIERGLQYLANNPYHKVVPGIQPISAPILPRPGIPGPGVLEYPYPVTTTTTAGLAQTLNIEQLQEQGVSQIKFSKPTQTRTLSPEEEQLKQQKIQQQLSRIKQQRIKFLKQKAEEILDYSLPYLRENDQKTIDWVLNQYPTDEDIVNYLQRVKKEDEEYEAEQDDYDIDEEELHEPQNEYYQKIKRYYTQNLAPYEFDDLISNAKANQLEYIRDYHQLNMFDALDIPHSHTWTDEEWRDMLNLLTEE